MEETMSKLSEDQEFRRLCSDLTLQTKKDGFFKDYLATITDKVSEEQFEGFKRQKTDKDRIIYCWTLPAFHETMAAFRPVYRAKTAEESVNRRTQGNAAFKDKDFKTSLKFYNQSVVFAPYSSQEEQTTLALALANRSAALVHLKEFRLAIRDIQLALQSAYPSNQRYKLYERMGYCYEHLGDTVKAKVAYNVAQDCLEGSDLDLDKIQTWKNNLNRSVLRLAQKKLKAEEPDRSLPTPPDLTSGSHPQFPAASKALALDSDPDNGRFFKAAQDIKPSQTLLYEKPYAACLLPDKFGSHCHHCFVRLIAPLGCMKCRGVAFCSAKCRDEASTYHRFECGVLDVFIGSGMSILAWVGVRMLTQKSGPDCFLKWRRALLEPEQHSTTPGVDLDLDTYRSVYNLVTLESQRGHKDFFDRTVMALFLFKCLRTSGYLTAPQNDDRSISEDEVWIATLLLRHLQLLQFNAHEIHEFLQPNEHTMRNTKTVYLGVGIYPTAAYFNHSCLPSVMRYFIGTSMVIRSARPIHRGEMVAENYGPIFTHKKKSDRQCSLKGRYWFQCNCQPCTGDWPLYDGMATLQEVLTHCPSCRGPVQTLPPAHTYGRCQLCKKQTPMGPIQDHIGQLDAVYQSGLTAMDQAVIDKAIKLLSIFVEMVEREVPNRPVRELHLAQEALRLCLVACGTKYSAANHPTICASTQKELQTCE